MANDTTSSQCTLELLQKTKENIDGATCSFFIAEKVYLSEQCSTFQWCYTEWGPKPEASSAALAATGQAALSCSLKTIIDIACQVSAKAEASGNVQTMQTMAAAINILTKFGQKF